LVSEAEDLYLTVILKWYMVKHYINNCKPTYILCSLYRPPKNLTINLRDSLSKITAHNHTLVVNVALWRCVEMSFHWFVICRSKTRVVVMQNTHWWCYDFLKCKFSLFITVKRLLFLKKLALYTKSVHQLFPESLSFIVHKNSQETWPSPSSSNAVIPCIFPYITSFKERRTDRNYMGSLCLILRISIKYQIYALQSTKHWLPHK